MKTGRTTKFELFKRHLENPIIQADHMPFPVNSVFNAAVARTDLGRKSPKQTVLLLRIEDRMGLSQIYKAISLDGINGWQIDSAPIIPATGDNSAEDPRLVFLQELKLWLVAYVRAFCSDGAMIELATSQNLDSFETIGTVLMSDNKDPAIFPGLINDRFWMMSRPWTDRKSIWISSTPPISDFAKLDRNCLRWWGDHKILMSAHGNAHWDGQHIGGNTPPIKTKYGWLFVFHGTKFTSSGPIYRLGLAMTALNNPTILTHRTQEYVMTPTFDYECAGDVGGAIFPCGWILDDEIIWLYYGAADTSICLAQAPLEEVLKVILANPV